MISLEKTIKKLDMKVLKKAQETDSVGCPFYDEEYKGPIHNMLNNPLCDDLCGVMFPKLKGRTGEYCPCHKIGKDKVKKKFWETVNKVFGD